jgi:hypothetical protein
MVICCVCKASWDRIAHYDSVGYFRRAPADKWYEIRCPHCGVKLYAQESGQTKRPRRESR